MQMITKPFILGLFVLVLRGAVLAADPPDHGRHTSCEAAAKGSDGYTWCAPEGGSFEFDAPHVKEMMRYLKDSQYKVIALRDLAEYIDPAKASKLPATK